MELKVTFRDRGWSWTLHHHDQLELWNGLELLAEIPAELLARILEHYLTGRELERILERRGRPAPREAEPAGPVAPILRDLGRRRLRRGAPPRRLRRDREQLA